MPTTKLRAFKIVYKRAVLLPKMIPVEPWFFHAWDDRYVANQLDVLCWIMCVKMLFDCSSKLFPKVICVVFNASVVELLPNKLLVKKCLHRSLCVTNGRYVDQRTWHHKPAMGPWRKVRYHILPKGNCELCEELTTPQSLMFSNFHTSTENSAQTWRSVPSIEGKKRNTHPSREEMRRVRSVCEKIPLWITSHLTSPPW